MLFLKVLDQREEDWEADRSGRGEVYVSPLPEKCRWRNWAAFVPDAEGKRRPQIPARELIGFVNNTL
jgi:type I restriction enzyme M protein